MERGVHHARRDLLGNLGAQHGLAGAAGEPHPVPVADAAHLGVVRMDLEQVLGMPHDIVGAARLRTDVVLRQDPAGGEDQRETAGRALAGRHVLGRPELALAAHELLHVHGRGALGGGVTRSLALDAHGKSLSSALLDLELPERNASA